MTQQISYRIDDRLYLSINDRCTLECRFCPKTHNDYQVKTYDLRMDHRPDAAEIIDSLGDISACREVVFCGYGEPTLRLNVLLEVAEAVKQRRGRVRVNTDGLGNLVHKRNILPEMSSFVDAISVSMNAQNEDIYMQHCQPRLPGSYEAMLDFLILAPDYIESVTATAINGLPGVEIGACQALTRHIGVHFRERQLDQVG